ncbi:MAG: TatD family hydrolase, partial [Deltaproteobacteria bacterium]|nr:TatD family hydrolase [Deltaproteobacteria bacterium]
MHFIDTHAHLDLPEFQKDRKEVIERARQADVKTMITVGIGIQECKAAIRLAEQYPFIYATVGMHPHNAKHLDLDALDFLEEQARHEKVVALGEMGLDFYRNRSPRQDQIRCFRAQLDLAGSLQLPVVIHDRDAHKESVAILREENGGAFGGVIHCFSGDAAMAFACIDMGFHISIPGTVTFKNARSLHEVVRKIPLASLLIETDCPFLTPVPNRGKRNEPAYVVRVAKQVAALKKVSVEAVAETTTRNARTVFGLPEAPKL